MRYRPLGRTGQFVSEICLGTMTFSGGAGILAGDRPARPGRRRRRWSGARSRPASISSTPPTSIRKAGPRFMLGQALRDVGARREDVIVATKVRGRMGPGPNSVGLSRGHIMDQIAASLKRLGLEHVDLYQIHGFDPATPIEETLRALDDCVRRGLVRTIGCSNMAAWQIMKALGISERRRPRALRDRAGLLQHRGARTRARDPAARRGSGPRRDGVEPARRRLSLRQVHARAERRRRFAPHDLRLSARRQGARLSTSSTRWRRSARRTAFRWRGSRSPGSCSARA